MHELLLHLENRGFDGTPKFLGVDDSGREILTFISGEVPGNDYPDLKPYMWSDDTLRELARLLRRYHDATQDFTPTTTGDWQFTYVDQSKHEVICHNDAALYNVVFQGRSPVALIDFDMAGPGPRMWDIAYSLYTSVPLASFAPDASLQRTVTYQPELHAEDRRRRIRVFMESYGMPVPRDLQRWVIERLHALCDALKMGAAKGNSAFQRMIDEGHLAHYENEIRFVTSHFEDWA